MLIIPVFSGLVQDASAEKISIYGLVHFFLFSSFKKFFKKKKRRKGNLVVMERHVTCF